MDHRSGVNGLHGVAFAAQCGEAFGSLGPSLALRCATYGRRLS